jgi:hypothetical protein
LLPQNRRPLLLVALLFLIQQELPAFADQALRLFRDLMQ